VIFLFQVIMLINGQPFTVSTNRYDSLRRLRSSAGNCTLLPEFRPVRFSHSTYIWRLLYHGFFCHGICCFLAGNFVLYMAGVFDSYTSATLFIIMILPLVATHLSTGSRSLGQFLHPWISLRIFGRGRYLLLRYLVRRF